jgi:Zn-dependent metalloprotease
MSSCCNPLQCVVPPYMLKELLKHKDPKVSESAYRSLMATADFRGFRRGAGRMATLMATGAGGLRRTIYNGNHATQLPGTLICREGEISQTSDGDAINAYNGLGDTYNFYKEVFNRNSIDNKGMRLDATVHYDDKYDNAFWNGGQMVFGDGDGVIFNDFTICLDVIGHELTHGVTQNECNLIYHGQSGALNESMSDVFGVLIRQYAAYKLGKPLQNPWLVGEGLLVHGGALRSMKAPGTAYQNDPNLGNDPQPATMAGYIETEEDNGGVHLNSGIPNHAFFLTADALGGNAWEEAGKIWYAGLPTLPESATFQQAADLFYRAAVGLFGTSSKQASAVGQAWADVGVAPSGTAHVTRAEGAAGTDLADTVLDKLADRVCGLLMERISTQLESKIRGASSKKPR